ncbi:delta-aminolevulinic acid dehydratase, partial [Parabacteroides distasonis]
EDGTPKYYDNQKFPIDIHCPGQLIVTLCRLHKLEKYKCMAEKVLNWTIVNMQSPKGYFYYQLKPGLSSKISYMRWSNAFMFNALSHYLRYSD